MSSTASVPLLAPQVQLTALQADDLTINRLFWKNIERSCKPFASQVFEIQRCLLSLISTALSLINPSLDANSNWLRGTILSLYPTKAGAATTGGTRFTWVARTDHSRTSTNYRLSSSTEPAFIIAGQRHFSDSIDDWPLSGLVQLKPARHLSNAQRVNMLEIPQMAQDGSRVLSCSISATLILNALFNSPSGAIR